MITDEENEFRGKVRMVIIFRKRRCRDGKNIMDDGQLRSVPWYRNYDNRYDDPNYYWANNVCRKRKLRKYGRLSMLR